MHGRYGVGRGQHRYDLRGHGGGRAHRQRRPFGDEIGEVDARDELHHQIQRPLVRSGVEDR